MVEMMIDDDEKNYRPCPYCTIQMASDATTCPHCESSVSPEHPEEEKVRDGVIDAVRDKKERIKNRLPLFLVLLSAIVLLYFGGSGLYNLVFGVNIVVAKNPDLPIRDVKIEFIEKKRVLRGTVVNNLIDVPVISLKSIGVKTEVEMKDGHRSVQTLFPRGPLNEPGALLLGDSGVFELHIPRKNVKEVWLGAEIIDLGGKKKFYHPGRKSRSR
jgi:hypothetical protein